MKLAKCTRFAQPFGHAAWIGLAGTALSFLEPTAALAADAGPQPDYARLGALLLAFFGIVVLFESGFSLLFQWRLFREFLSVAGWRTPIMFVASAILVTTFPTLDIFWRGIVAFQGTQGDVRYDGSLSTWLISAAILAGGSAGMMRIFEQLGIRSPVTEPTLPAIDQSKAWVSLQVAGPSQVVGTVVVTMEQADGADIGMELAGIAGTLREESAWIRFRRVMGRNLRRFPPSGGYLVEAKKPYRIMFSYPKPLLPGGTAETWACDIFSRPVSIADGPKAVSFASRAIVDLTVVLPTTQPSTIPGAQASLQPVVPAPVPGTTPAPATGLP